MTSRGSKVKDVGTGKTSAGHNRSQDWERKASLTNEDDVVDKADAEPSGKKHNDGRHEDGNRKRRSKETSVERPSKVNRKDAGSLAVGHAREVASGSIRKGNNGGKCVDAPAGRKIVDAAKSSAPVAEVAGDASRVSRTEQSRAILTNKEDSSGGLVGELRASNALNDGVRAQRHRKSGHKSLQRRKKVRVDLSGPESQGAERVRVVVAGTVNYIEVPVTRDVIVLDKGETSSDPLATIKTEPVEEEAQRPSPNIQRQLHSKGPIYDSVYSNLGPVKSEIVDEPKPSTPTVRVAHCPLPVVAPGGVRVKQEEVAASDEIEMDFEEQKYSETLMLMDQNPPSDRRSSADPTPDPVDPLRMDREVNFIAVPSQTPEEGERTVVDLEEDPFADAADEGVAVRVASTLVPRAEALLNGGGAGSPPTVPGIGSILAVQDALEPSPVDSGHDYRSSVPGAELREGGTGGVVSLGARSGVSGNRNVRTTGGPVGLAANVVGLGESVPCATVVMNPGVGGAELGVKCKDVSCAGRTTVDVVGGQVSMGVAGNSLPENVRSIELESSQVAAPSQIGYSASRGSEDDSSVGEDGDEDATETGWQSDSEGVSVGSRRVSVVDLGRKGPWVVLQRLDEAVVEFWKGNGSRERDLSVSSSDNEQQSKPSVVGRYESDGEEWTPRNFWGSDWGSGESNSDEDDYDDDFSLSSRKRPNILARERQKSRHKRHKADRGSDGDVSPPSPRQGGNASDGGNVLLTSASPGVDVGNLITRLQKSSSGGYIVMVNPGRAPTQKLCFVSQTGGGTAGTVNASVPVNPGRSSQEAGPSHGMRLDGYKDHRGSASVAVSRLRNQAAGGTIVKTSVNLPEVARVDTSPAVVDDLSGDPGAEMSNDVANVPLAVPPSQSPSTVISIGRPIEANNRVDVDTVAIRSDGGPEVEKSSDSLYKDVVGAIFGWTSTSPVRTKSVIERTGRQGSQSGASSDLGVASTLMTRETASRTLFSDDLNARANDVEVTGGVAVLNRFVPTNGSSEEKTSLSTKPPETVNVPSESWRSVGCVNTQVCQSLATVERSTVVPSTSSNLSRLPSAVTPGAKVSTDGSQGKIHSLSDVEKNDHRQQYPKPGGSVRDLVQIATPHSDITLHNLLQSAQGNPTGIAVVECPIFTTAKPASRTPAKNVAVIRPIVDQTKSMGRSGSDSSTLVHNGTGRYSTALQNVAPEGVSGGGNVRDPSAVMPQVVGPSEEAITSNDTIVPSEGMRSLGENGVGSLLESAHNYQSDSSPSSDRGRGIPNTPVFKEAHLTGYHPIAGSSESLGRVEGVRPSNQEALKSIPRLVRNIPGSTDHSCEGTVIGPTMNPRKGPGFVDISLDSETTNIQRQGQKYPDSVRNSSDGAPVRKPQECQRQLCSVVKSSEGTSARNNTIMLEGQNNSGSVRPSLDAAAVRNLQDVHGPSCSVVINPNGTIAGNNTIPQAAQKETVPIGCRSDCTASSTVAKLNWDSRQEEAVFKCLWCSDMPLGVTALIHHIHYNHQDVVAEFTMAPLGAKGTVGEGKPQQIVVNVSKGGGRVEVVGSGACKPAIVQSISISGGDEEACENMLVKCVWCGKIAHRFMDLTQHMNKEHREELLVLISSQQVGSTDTSPTASRPTPLSYDYKCAWCENVCPTLSTLEIHIRVQHPEQLKQSKCLGELTAPSAAELQVHKNTVGTHELSGRQTQGSTSLSSNSAACLEYKCRWCLFVARSTIILEEHMEKNHADLICRMQLHPKKAQGSMPKLESVESTHISVKQEVKRTLVPIPEPGNFKCRYCPEEFRYKSALKEHKKVFHSVRGLRLKRTRSRQEGGRPSANDSKQPAASTKVYKSPRGIFIDSAGKDEKVKIIPSQSNALGNVRGEGSGLTEDGGAKISPADGSLGWQRQVTDGSRSSAARNTGGETLSADEQTVKNRESEPSTSKSEASKVSENQAVRCSTCALSFPSVVEMQAHVVRSHSEVSEVTGTVLSEGELKATNAGGGEERGGAEAKTTKCRMCNLQFAMHSEYVNHFAKVHMPEVYEKQKQLQRDRLNRGVGVTSNAHTFL
ncbi:uncharacterized protein LOC124170124 isoform X2 [Ischnura elegans]|uniref:uncharacterized protein LOC124170124 isoform X2 n=1 Tax=Ischnura elegans TaxID=197161 RepID=UPI001ED8A4E8|nr:uncharacterized protein LOC124170124 isoform X2 [Ischnura elegans]